MPTTFTPERQQPAGAALSYRTPAPQARVVIADDHDLVRLALKALLRAMPGVEVVGEARTGEELERLVIELDPDVAITDLSMPGMDGMEAMSRLLALQRRTRLLVLSIHDSPDMVRQAVSSGACGYVMKDAPAFELEYAIRTVMLTGSYFSSHIAALLLRQEAAPPPGDDLTPRQEEVLRRVASGKSAKQIGQELGLSPKTVDVHRTRLMAKLDLHDIAGLTRYAVRKGFVDA
jgi:DNA-binding NarL/FixJ family response regulator